MSKWEERIILGASYKYKKTGAIRKVARISKWDGDEIVSFHPEGKSIFLHNFFKHYRRITKENE
jgi:hypothetical protein